MSDPSSHSNHHTATATATTSPMRPKSKLTLPNPNATLEKINQDISNKKMELDTLQKNYQELQDLKNTMANEALEAEKERRKEKREIETKVASLQHQKIELEKEMNAVQLKYEDLKRKYQEKQTVDEICKHQMKECQALEIERLHKLEQKYKIKIQFIQSEYQKWKQEADAKYQKIFDLYMGRNEADHVMSEGHERPEEERPNTEKRAKLSTSQTIPSTSPPPLSSLCTLHDAGYDIDAVSMPLIHYIIECHQKHIKDQTDQWNHADLRMLLEYTGKIKPMDDQVQRSYRRLEEICEEVFDKCQWDQTYICDTSKIWRLYLQFSPSVQTGAKVRIENVRIDRIVSLASTE